MVVRREPAGGFLVFGAVGPCLALNAPTAAGYPCSPTRRRTPNRQRGCLLRSPEQSTVRTTSVDSFGDHSTKQRLRALAPNWQRLFASCKLCTPGLPALKSSSPSYPC